MEYYKQQYLKWLQYLQQYWGLQESFAMYVGGAQAYIQSRGGIAVPIVSGLRSARYQRALQERWDAGHRRGLVSRPASRSWHMQGLAVDVMTNHPNFPAFRWLMLHWGNRWGGNFSSYDPVHFDRPTGELLSIDQIIAAGQDKVYGNLG